MRILSIIVLQYNNCQLTIDLLNSLYEKENEAAKWDIYLIDNNSSEEDSFELIKNLFPDVIRFKNTINLGFAGGINSIMDRIKTDYILFLNNDMILLNAAISLTLKTALKKNADAITCKIIGINGNQQYTSNLKLSSLNILLSLFGAMFFFKIVKSISKSSIRVGYINGAFLMIKTNIFKNVGMFDQSFFMYGEDIDLMLKLNKRNAKMYYSPNGLVRHLDGASAKKVWSLDQKYLVKTRNSLRAHEKNKGKLSILLLKGVLIFKELLKLLVYRRMIFIKTINEIVSHKK